jgi:cell division protein FtsW
MRPKPRINRQNNLQRPDWVIAASTLALIAFGVLMVFEASLVEAFHTIGDKWYFIRNQSQFALVGILAAMAAIVFPIKKLEKLALPLMIFSLILLVLVLIPGLGQKIQGARRWLDLGIVRFQPSEFAKLATIIYLSAWFAKPRPARSFFLLISIIIGLIMLEPDLGTALVIGSIAAVMYFLSGAPFKKLAKLAAIGFIGIVLLIAVSPYRMDRVKTFLDPMHDPLGVSYHARQILISLGSGGLTGTGLGRSRQKFQYLPEASTDSIFAVVGEEFGFVGAILLIGTLSSIVVRGFEHVKRIKDPFIKNLAAGVAIWFAAQVILNLMAMVALVPLTGIPLPLISYGGSALVTMMAGIGLLLNASRYRDPKTTFAKPRRRLWK